MPEPSRAFVHIYEPDPQRRDHPSGKRGMAPHCDGQAVAGSIVISLTGDEEVDGRKIGGLYMAPRSIHTPEERVSVPLEAGQAAFFNRAIMHGVTPIRRQRPRAVYVMLY